MHLACNDSAPPQQGACVCVCVGLQAGRQASCKLIPLLYIVGTLWPLWFINALPIHNTLNGSRTLRHCMLLLLPTISWFPGAKADPLLTYIAACTSRSFLKPTWLSSDTRSKPFECHPIMLFSNVTRLLYGLLVTHQGQFSPLITFVTSEVDQNLQWGLFIHNTPTYPWECITSLRSTKSKASFPNVSVQLSTLKQGCNKFKSNSFFFLIEQQVEQRKLSC